MIFFLDENLHVKIVPDILRKAGLEVEQHKDHFEQGLDDTIWIPEVARRGWIAVTLDVNTRKALVEVRAIISSKARVIQMIPGKNANHTKHANNFLNTFEEIKLFMAKHQPPYVVMLNRPDKVEDLNNGFPGKLTLMDLNSALRKRRAR